MPSFLRSLIIIWRIIRAPFWLSFGLIIGFLGPYLFYFDAQVRSRFDDLSWQIPSRVYARPFKITPEMPLTPEALELELAAARYQPDPDLRVAGTYHRTNNRFSIARRTFISLDGREEEKRFSITLANGRVSQLDELNSGKALRAVYLDPARIATLYGALAEERKVVQLEEVPVLLITGLQAVEDRHFKNHHGIAITAILRAVFANLMAGHMVQGGSTLTQQLVKNLFLDRTQSLVRKVNEALLALIIEARYDKRRILEAYLNEIFMGQQGGQAIHGFAAASEFYFSRDIQNLRPAEIAFLIGLVQGPSLYDPRRSPERALARRNRVLRQFFETGLIDQKTLDTALSTPLGIATTASLPRDRFPAFLDLVRLQIKRDYPSAELNSAGLSIHTTLAPSTQILAENALEKALATLSKKNAAVEAALVVTGTQDGEVHAVIGGRDPDAPGFNRALDALRPIGSLVKPLVYLAALAQPQRYSLASLIDDTPVDLPQADGSRWTPKNADGQWHGSVLIIDALVHSWNLASVHLGMQVGVDKIRGLIESFGLQREINPNPSLLLGAVDLSPIDVAQLYQYFAADGHALPLRTVRGVIDAHGKALSRYSTKPGTGDYVEAVRLINYALQHVAISGTAHAIGEADLGSLHAAGKTGTSDTQRDSWFAGFTGSHLAVVWVGRDDNKPTGLMGATGALRVWIELFRHLPTLPLEVSQEGLEQAWIDPASGHRTDADCAQARPLPFIAGYTPGEINACPWDKVKSFFDGN